MTIKKSTWLCFLALAILGLIIWWRFSYPQLAFTNFSVDRAQARQIARDYLTQELNIDLTPYHETVVFHSDEETNRFLQRSKGYQGMVKFLKEEDLELFYWVVRYFKEKEKRGYYAFINSATGEVISYREVLDDTFAIPTIERDVARAAGIDFLRKRYGFDPELYSVKGDLKHNYDNRADYAFSWQKRDVAVAWSDEPDAGYGRLVASVKISGDRVLSFNKNSFQVPEKFKLEVDSLRNTGQNLSTLFRIINFLLLFAAVFTIVVRRNHLAMHLTKKFYIGLAIFLFLLSAFNIVNQFQSFLFDYRTSLPLTDYLLRIAIDGCFSGIIISTLILMPSLAGELLNYEQFPQKKGNAFLHNLRTTFFSREVSGQILMGYLVCLALLGIQALLTEIGQRYWGVWQEYPWMTQLTTSYFPILAGFTMAYKASVTEEVMFRMFSISFGKRIFKKTWIAVVIASLIWGFGHSGYAVFPQWFRGVEVTILGLFLSVAYLRFGIITVIVAHYLFDAFWGSAAYLLGGTAPAYFFTACALLLLPFLFALIAYAMNRRPEEKPLQWLFNKHQQYNLNILKNYLRANWDHFGRMERGAVEKEIASHYWDLVVVQTALDEVYREKGAGKA